MEKFLSLAIALPFILIVGDAAPARAADSKVLPASMCLMSASGFASFVRKPHGLEAAEAELVYCPMYLPVKSSPLTVSVDLYGSGLTKCYLRVTYDWANTMLGANLGVKEYSRTAPGSGDVRLTWANVEIQAGGIAVIRCSLADTSWLQSYQWTVQ